MLIGITGPAGCGKDTVGEILAREHGFACFSFAQQIKDTVCALLGYPSEQWNDREWRETEVPVWDCTPRHMAQTLGTEWGRRCIKESIWIDLTLSQFDSEADDVAITDVRFRNEADVIRSPEQKGYVLHVHRMETEASGQINRKHASEQGVGNPNTEDFHINNFGTVEDLAVQVFQVVARILELQQAALEQAKEAEKDEKV